MKKPSKTPKKPRLTVGIEDQEIVIRLPISVLVLSADTAFEREYQVGHGIKVTDPETFAADVLAELEREDEEGTTTVHELFDQAMCAAVENGSEGVEESEDEEEDEEE